MCSWRKKNSSPKIASPFFYGLFLTVLLQVTPSLAHAATTYYVSSEGSNDNKGTLDAPFRTLDHAARNMVGGDTLIVQDGTYTGEDNQIWNLPNGQADRYTTIKAEHPFGVILEATGKNAYEHQVLRTPIRLMNNAYIQIEGLKIRNSPTGGAIFMSASHHIKLLRLSIKNGTRFDDPWGSPLTITQGSHHILVEDVWITGAMRYGVLISGNNKSGSNREEDTTRQVILRRVVVRWDYIKTVEPKAAIAFYGADDFSKNGAVVDSVCQNCLVLDLNPGDGYDNMYGAYYNPKTTQNIGYYGSIALNIKGKTTQSVIGGFFVADNYNQNKGQKVIQSVAWDIDGPAVRFSRGDPKGWGEVSQSTLGESQYGVYTGGETGVSRLPVRVRNTLLLNNKETFSSIQDFLPFTLRNLYFPAVMSFILKDKLVSVTHPTQALTSDPGLKYLVRIERNSPAYRSGEDGVSRGATILHRYGKSETLWGEEGWDTLTTEPLWPWPYEDQIRSDFREPNNPPPGAYPPQNETHRGFCAKDKTLTKYIWEYLGNPMPKSLGL
jgi:hypothetical protein